MYAARSATASILRPFTELALEPDCLPEHWKEQLVLIKVQW